MGHSWDTSADPRLLYHLVLGIHLIDFRQLVGVGQITRAV